MSHLLEIYKYKKEVFLLSIWLFLTIFFPVLGLTVSLLDQFIYYYTKRIEIKNHVSDFQSVIMDMCEEDKWESPSYTDKYIFDYGNFIYKATPFLNGKEIEISCEYKSEKEIDKIFKWTINQTDEVTLDYAYNEKLEDLLDKHFYKKTMAMIKRMIERNLSKNKQEVIEEDIIDDILEIYNIPRPNYEEVYTHTDKEILFVDIQNKTVELLRYREWMNDEEIHKLETTYPNDLKDLEEKYQKMNSSAKDKAKKMIKDTEQFILQELQGIEKQIENRQLKDMENKVEVVRIR